MRNKISLIGKCVSSTMQTVHCFQCNFHRLWLLRWTSMYKRIGTTPTVNRVNIHIFLIKHADTDTVMDDQLPYHYHFYSHQQTHFFFLHPPTTITTISITTTQVYAAPLAGAAQFLGHVETAYWVERLFEISDYYKVEFSHLYKSLICFSYVPCILLISNLGDGLTIL